MPNRILLSVLLTLILLHLTSPPPLTANQCSLNTYGISTLRGDAQYPPEWDQFGGALLIRNPYVQLHATGTTFLIKGIEFYVKNNSKHGETQTPNPLVEGDLQLVIRYLPQDSEQQQFCFVPRTHIFETNVAGHFHIHDTAASPEPINSGYVHLTASIPDLADYIPSNARDMALLLIYSGSFEIETPISVALGSYQIDPAIEDSTRIAFVRQTDPLHPGNIASRLPDGDDERSLTQWLSAIDNGWTGHWSPAWGPGGTRLAYNQTMCLEPDINGTTCTRIKDGGINYISEIMVINSPASTPFPENIVDAYRIEDEPLWALDGYMPIYAPSFSPVGDQLAVTAQGDVLEFLVLMDAASGGWHVTPDCPNRGIGDTDCWDIMYNSIVVHSPPSWNPKDDTIAVTLGLRADDTGNDDTPFSEIYLIQPDGSQFTQLTSDNYLDHSPAWTPDGQWLAFVSNRDGGPSTDLWMMDRTGTNLQKIFECAPGCTSPSFSPDGRRIAFSQAGIVKTLGIGTETATQVTPEGLYANAPDWSPYLDEHTPAIAMTADALKVTPGAPVSLSWTSTDADHVILDNGIGEQPNLSGSLTVYPTSNTTYTISAHNWAGRATASVTIIVQDP